jgi:hypothetical protein
MSEWYNRTLTLIGRSLLDLNSLSNPKIVPVTSGYVFSQAHEFLSDITPAERVSSPIAMTNVTFGPQTTITPTDYLAYYNFDETSGTLLADSSGNGYDATLVAGSVGIDGKVNKCIEYTAATNYASIAADTAFSNLTDVSVAAWVNSSVLLGAGSVGEIWYNFAAGATQRGEHLYVTKSTGRPGWAVSYDDGFGDTTDRVANGVTDVLDGQWHLIVGTYNNTTGVGKIYVDTVLESSFTGGRINHNVAVIGVGARQSGGNKAFTGKMDELKVYDYELLAADITTGGAEGWLDCDDPVITGPTVADIIEAFVVVEDTGVEATSPVIVYADEAPGLPFVVQTTGAITVQLANSNGIAKL